MKEPWPTKNDVGRELLFASAMWGLISLSLLACMIFGAGVALGAW